MPSNTSIMEIQEKFDTTLYFKKTLLLGWTNGEWDSETYVAALDTRPLVGLEGRAPSAPHDTSVMLEEVIRAPLFANDINICSTPFSLFSFTLFIQINFIFFI